MQKKMLAYQIIISSFFKENSPLPSTSAGQSTPIRSAPASLLNTSVKVSGDVRHYLSYKASLKLGASKNVLSPHNFHTTRFLDLYWCSLVYAGLYIIMMQSFHNSQPMRILYVALWHIRGRCQVISCLFRAAIMETCTDTGFWIQLQILREKQVSYLTYVFITYLCLTPRTKSVASNQKLWLRQVWVKIRKTTHSISHYLYNALQIQLQTVMLLNYRKIYDFFFLVTLGFVTFR